MTETVSLKVRVQKVGTALSNMVMPNIPILIAWGLITAFFIPAGFTPNATIATVVTPVLTFLIPTAIAFVGGKNVYDIRGGVVGAIATFGAIIAAASVHYGGLQMDSLHHVKNAVATAQLYIGTDGTRMIQPGHMEVVSTNIPMILGAMILGPLTAWIVKKFDAWVQPHIKTGFEMLVNNFSGGIIAGLMLILSLKVFGPAIEGLMNILTAGVNFLVTEHLIPLANLFIEPAKILFLNNAINHGVLTPIGLEQVAAHGKSILFLLEANPGPGLGILLAFMFFGKGSAKATAPGAALIHFVGGIHEIYFPYVMMKPALFLAVMAGGVAGTTTNSLLNSGLIAPAAPGSIISITAMAAGKGAGGLGNLLSVYAGVIVAAGVSFIVASFILKRDKSMTDDSFDVAKEEVAADKAISKGQTPTTKDVSVDFTNIKHIIFACDAGMGSSAMGASILRNKAKKAGLSQDVTNVAIANLKAGPDTIVVTQDELAPRAATMAPRAIRYSVVNFLNSPRYDEIIGSLAGNNEENNKKKVLHEEASTDDIDLNQIDEVVFAHDDAHIGSSTMGKETLQAIFQTHDVKIPVSDVEFTGLGAFNASNIVVVTSEEFTTIAKSKAPNAQHLSVESLITTPEYLNMVNRMNK